MPISEAECVGLKAPFYVVGDYQRGKRKGQPKREKPSKVVGFTQNDPLGVGGGIFPDFPTAHFESGGWILVQDLLAHHSILPADWPKSADN